MDFKRFLILPILFCWTIAYGQRDVTHQHFYWLKYKVDLSISENWSVAISAEDRRYIRNNRQHMWLFDLPVSYQLQENWVIGGGLLKWSTLMPSDPESAFEVTQHEWRPYIFIKKKIVTGGRLAVKNRIKLEQRFRQNRDTDPVSGSPVINDGYYTYNRLRLRSRLVWLLTKASAALPLHLTISDELMIHWGENQLPGLYDQNRLGVYLSADIFPGLNWMLGYTNWYQKRSGESRYFSRNILMCYVTQKF